MLLTHNLCPLQLGSVPELQGIKSHTSESIATTIDQSSAQQGEQRPTDVETTVDDRPAVNITNSPTADGQPPPEKETKADIPPPHSPAQEPITTPTGVKASEDYRYKKFFKMMHFGVPQQAAKNKLISEGLDPSVLE